MTWTGGRRAKVARGQLLLREFSRKSAFHYWAGEQTNFSSPAASESPEKCTCMQPPGQRRVADCLLGSKRAKERERKERPLLFLSSPLRTLTYMNVLGGAHSSKSMRWIGRGGRMQSQIELLRQINPAGENSSLPADKVSSHNQFSIWIILL